MAIEGSLSDVSLADICQLLSLGRKTGCLTVTDHSNFGYIYFKSGRVVYASVLNRPDRLGDILIKNGVIEAEEFTRAMEEQSKEGDRKLGEILIDFGVVSIDELQKWVSLQVEEAVYHLFSWNRGTFHFKPDEAPDQAQVLLVSLSADGLLLEGARRVDEWSIIEKEVDSLDLIYKLGRDPRETEGIETTANQRRIIPLLDGVKTVRDLVEESGLVEFETGKAIYELAKAGFVQKVGEKVTASADEEDRRLQEHIRLGQAFYRAGMLEDATTEFSTALEMDPSEPNALFRMGLIQLKGEANELALEFFESMPEGWAQRPSVMKNRALALEVLGRFQEATELLREAEGITSDNVDLTLARGIAELKGGDPGSARSTFVAYRNRVGKGAPSPLYYAYAVMASAAERELDEAVSIGREGLKLYPANGPILVNTGAILDHKGNHEAAEQYFIRALQSGSEVPPQAHKNLGDQALRRGDTAGAQAHYERAVRLDPSLGDDVFLQLGSIASELGDEDLAIMFLRRCIELNPENEEARGLLSDLSAVP